MASQFRSGDISGRRPRMKLCDCGCGGYPRTRDYMPGHEMQIFAALVSHVGGIRNLREVVEQYTGKPIEMTQLNLVDRKYTFRSDKSD